MRFFITKYALANERISELEMDEPKDGDNYVYDRRDGHWNQFHIGRNAFVDRAEAVKAANAERDKKIASLKKSIARLEKLLFE